MSEKNKQKMGPNEWIILDLFLKKSIQCDKPIMIYYSVKTNLNINKDYINNTFPNENINRINNLNTEQYLGIPLISIGFNASRFKFYTKSSDIKNNEIYKFIFDNENKIIELHEKNIKNRKAGKEFKNKFERIKNSKDEDEIELQDWASCIIKVLNAFIYTKEAKESTTVNKFGEGYFYKNNLETLVGKSAINSIFSDLKKDYIDFYSFVKNCYKYYGSYIELCNQLFYKTSMNTNDTTKFNLNRLLFGAPGTGKSNKLEKDAESLCKCSLQNAEEFITRVTFYPEYTYGQFIGCYKPTPIYSDEFKNIKVFLDDYKENTKENPLKPYIDYKIEIGPFLKVFIEAIKHKEKNFVLIIDEINRGNASAIFGDIIQLLDRTDNGDSEYSIELSPALMSYLKGKGISKVKIPSNLYIWATMNSSDESIEPIDTAFMRRWTLEYVGINEYELDADNCYISFPFIKSNEKFVKENLPVAERKIKWNTFRKKINDKLIHGNVQLEEDKLLGPFFIKRNEFNSDNIIKSKLIIYLYKELLRYGVVDSIFNSKYESIYDLLEGYESEECIFNFKDFEINAMVEETININNQHINEKKEEMEVAAEDDRKEVTDTGDDPK